MPDIELKTQHCPFTAAQTVCCINTEDMILLCVTLLIILCINMHAWDEENPHVLWRRGYQYRFSTNVWCGIIIKWFHCRSICVSWSLIRPWVPWILRTRIIIITRGCTFSRAQIIIWYMHNGTPAHSSMTVREYVDAKFPGRWIGSCGPIPWPARSPDLNPIDFYLWGHLKSMLTVDTEEEPTSTNLGCFSSCT